jgi:glycosyltransferase A (GT-A) superfamily protein (DUF2064 family)
MSGHNGGASAPSAARAALLVLAKAPVAGLAKTRLCPPASPRAAALIAAASLLDTLDTVLAAAEAPGTAPLLAWTGSLDAAERRHELVTALASVTRFEQRGGALGERIAAAHADAAVRAPGAVVLQIGTDTPQLAAGELTEALALLTATRGPDAVLGPATDGGWWALGLRDPLAAAAIAAVPTSRPDTGERTLRALRDEGLTVALLDEHRDVDTAADAWAVAAGGAGPRFTAEIAAHLGAPTDAAAAPPAIEAKIR